MKISLPFILLVVCVLGCNKFGPDTASTSNSDAANVKPAPAAPVKVVDLPAAMGKSADDIKKMIDGTPTHEDPWLEYSLPQAELTFMFDKQKKAKDATFKFKPVSFGGATLSGTGTAEQLGTMAGIDIKGKTPNSTSSLADTYEQEIGGKKAEVVFYRTGDTFNTVMIHVK
jgi:hypothetical protein